MSEAEVRLPTKLVEVFSPKRGEVRYRGAHGGRGCVHPDTLLNTPLGKIPIKDFRGGSVFSYRYGQITVEQATAPKRYSPAQLFEVEVGEKKIICTGKHKFKVASGWKELRYLRVGEGVRCVSDLPRSSSAFSLQEIWLSVRRYFQKAPDFQECYSEDFHQYGGQPLLFSDTGQVHFPSPACEQQHTGHISRREDVPEFVRNCNFSQSSRLHSSRAFLPSAVVKNCVAVGNYISERFSGLLLVCGQVYQKFLSRTSPLPQARQLSARTPVFCTSKRLAKIRQKVFGNLAFSSLDNPYNTSFVTSTPTTLSPIKSIRKHSFGEYYDIHIPTTGCYFAEGILHHNSGKSFGFALMACVMGVQEPLRILCTRDLQNSIKESFHAELRSAIATTPFLQAHYEVGESYIRGKNGTEFLFKGLRHNMAAIKSMAQIDICIVEEAEDILEESWIDLIPTIRADNSEIWVIWNPKMEGSPVDLRLRRYPPNNAVVAEVNYLDNPWFPKVLEAERLNDLATLDLALYKHIWEGSYLVDNEFSLIRYDVVREAFDRKVGYLNSTKIMGVDVGMSLTGDPSALGVRQGPAVIHMEEFNYDDTFSIAGRIRNRAEDLGVSAIVVDAISWGKGVADTLAGWNLPVLKLNVGEVATQRERFYNLKSELWWAMAEWFNGLQCSIHPFDLRTKLAMELCAPKYGYNPNGKIIIEKKGDLLKRGIKSTNLADCLMHSFAMPSMPVTAFGPTNKPSKLL